MKSKIWLESTVNDTQKIFCLRERIRTLFVKFVYSEKATKFGEIFTLLLTDTKVGDSPTLTDTTLRSLIQGEALIKGEAGIFLQI